MKASTFFVEACILIYDSRTANQRSQSASIGEVEGGQCVEHYFFVRGKNSTTIQVNIESCAFVRRRTKEEYFS